MDFQAFVDSVGAACAVLSVERTMVEGHCGEIRIVKANQLYRDTMGPRFYENMPYHELVPKDIKFEDYCYRAAILGQRMHWYVETKAMNCWTDASMIPMVSDDFEVGYCQFIFEFTPVAEAERMAEVSVDTAERVIKSCITLIGAEDFRTGVGEVLEDIIAVSNAFCCRVQLIDHKKKTTANFCERFRPDPAFRPDPTKGVFSYELVNSWESVIGVSNAVLVKDEHDIRALAAANPAWAESLRDYNIESLLLIPLRQRHEVIGYLYIVNYDVEKVVELKELVELVSFFLGVEISNHMLMDRLEEMSRIDALTGLNNRYAMLQRMSDLREERTPFGVINMDLNGLKDVNDTQGHDAGDRLLVQAAEILRKVFYQQDIYRTGGDEFIVIARDISRETFDAKVARLRGDVCKNSAVSFAVGAYWSDGDKDVAAAFRKADQRMYADKQRYYERRGGCRREQRSEA